MKLNNIKYSEQWLDCSDDKWYKRLWYAFVLVFAKKVKYYEKTEKLPPGPK